MAAEDGRTPKPARTLVGIHGWHRGSHQADRSASSATTKRYGSGGPTNAATNRSTAGTGGSNKRQLPRLTWTAMTAHVRRAAAHRSAVSTHRRARSCATGLMRSTARLFGCAPALHPRLRSSASLRGRCRSPSVSHSREATADRRLMIMASSHSDEVHRDPGPVGRLGARPACGAALSGRLGRSDGARGRAPNSESADGTAMIVLRACAEPSDRT